MIHKPVSSCGIMKIYKRYCLVVLFFICSYTLYYIYDTFNSTNCTDTDSKEVINDLCKQHLSGNAAGNLCPDLCSKGKIKYQKCTNYRGGKQVIVTKWDQIMTVFKSKQAYYHDYDSVAYPGQRGRRAPRIESFTSMIKDSIEFNFKIKIPENELDDLTNIMWTRDFKKFIKRNEDDAQRLLGAYQSLYSLIQQDEYLFVKYFQSSKHIPQIYGSCGHFYAMEYLPPGKLLSPNIFKPSEYFSSWKDRVDLALGLLELVHSLKNDFAHPVHICDVKGENFGRGNDRMIKIIDTDSVFFEPKLKDLLVNETCKVHDDCNFFDCQGFCNLRKQKCTDRRINSNLQAVCRKIFTTGIENMYSGLLDNPPAHLKSRMDLISLINYCSKSLVFKRKSPKEVDMNEDEALVQLKKLLQESL